MQSEFLNFLKISQKTAKTAFRRDLILTNLGEGILSAHCEDLDHLPKVIELSDPS